MDDHMLANEWAAARRRSIRVFPIAVGLFIALGMVVYVEGLHRSDAGFLAGVLVGTLGYWAILEAMTVVRIGRLLRTATSNREGVGSSAGAG